MVFKKGEIYKQTKEEVERLVESLDFKPKGILRAN